MARRGMSASQGTVAARRTRRAMTADSGRAATFRRVTDFDAAFDAAPRDGRGERDGTPADWAELGPRWPHREASRFVRAGGLTWHVQVMGQGPVALLVHGTGGATHSWRGVMPLLARRFTVVAPDLPGHGFTGVPPAHGLSLAGMGALLATLLAALGPALDREVGPDLVASPAVAVGHSAGAAVLLRMMLDSHLSPAAVVGVNAALEPPPALYSSLLAPAIGAFASSSFVATLAARAASAPGVVRSLLRSTGSALDDDQIALYEALCRSAPRTGAVLTMMANWELGPLRDDLARVSAPVTLVAADDDGWVPPRVARDAAQRLPRARVVPTTGGHLVHEVRPSEVAAAIIAAAAG